MGAHLDKPVVGKETEAAAAHGLRFGTSTMQGWRQEQEDAHTLVPSVPGLPGHSFVAIYDGHGGKAAALVAAEMALGYVRKQPEFEAYNKVRRAHGSGDDAARLLGAAMQKAYLQLDRELVAPLKDKNAEVDEPEGSSGCTAVAVMLTPTHLVCANIGDSRAAYSQLGPDGAAVAERPDGSATLGAGNPLLTGRVVALSEDHKPANPEERARIEAAGGFVEGDRVDGRLALSRALGDFEFKDAATPQPQQKVSAEAEVRVRARGDADQVLVVACDGVWDVLSNDEACGFVERQLAGGEADLGVVAEELLECCLAKNSRDNMTAAVVAFPAAAVGNGPGAAPARAARVERRRLEQLECERREKEKAAETKAVLLPDGCGEPEAELTPGLGMAKLLGAAGGQRVYSLDSLDGFDGETPSAAAPAEKKRGPRPAPSTPEQLAQLRTVFDSFDADGNGVLDRGEVKEAAYKLGRPIYAEADLDKAMAAMDADGDGTVDFGEFREWWEGGGKLSASEQFDLQWQSFGAAFDRLTAGLIRDVRPGALGL
jgi:protein phosphatase 1B